MKTKMLCALMALFLISCSSDDSIPVDNPVPEQSVKKLDRILYTTYTEDGAISTTSQIVFDDHDKILSRKDFADDGVLTAKSIYTYDGAGLLTKRESDDYDFGIHSETDYTYDNSGRITEYLNTLDTAEDSQLKYYLYTFQYNNNGTISNNIKGYTYSNQLGHENEQIIFYTKQYTYFVDAIGNIIKRTSGSSDLDMVSVFDGLDLQSYTSPSGSTIVLSYGIENTLKGQYLNMYVNTSGSRQNAILLNSYGVLANGSTKYVTKSVETTNSASRTLNYHYEFDEDGYPIKVSLFLQGNTQPYEVREITYQ